MLCPPSGSSGGGGQNLFRGGSAFRGEEASTTIILCPLIELDNMKTGDESVTLLRNSFRQRMNMYIVSYSLFKNTYSSPFKLIL